MAKLNFLLSLNSYLDSTSTNNPNLNIIKWARDFQGFVRDLVEYLKIYFPQSYQDFNSSSSGMMLLELCAFIGDNLNFYLDQYKVYYH